MNGKKMKRDEDGARFKMELQGVKVEEDVRSRWDEMGGP
jgi:hypothetical protein